MAEVVVIMPATSDPAAPEKRDVIHQTSHRSETRFFTTLGEFAATVRDTFTKLNKPTG